jgi:transposase-like protein
VRTDIRTPPARIVVALEVADRIGVRATARELGIHHKQLYRWRRHVAEVGWPTFEQMRQWRQTADERAEYRARKAASAREYRKVVYLNRGPMHVDSTGTARRLQALARQGWGTHDLAPLLGVSHTRVGHLRSRLYPLVHRDTRGVVARVFDDIGLKTGPSPKAAGHAARAGWVPSLGWDEDAIDDPNARPKVNPRAEVIYHLDEVAIEETMAGRRVKLSHEERQEVFRRLIDRGLNASQIAQRLGMTRAAAQKMATRVRSRGQVAA